MILKTRLNAWLLIATIITALFISGCKKDEDPKPVDPAPDLNVTVLYTTVDGVAQTRTLRANDKLAITPKINLFSLRMQVEKSISWRIMPQNSNIPYKEVQSEQGDNTTQVIPTAKVSVVKAYYKGQEFYSAAIEVTNFEDNVVKEVVTAVKLKYITANGSEQVQPFASGTTITIPNDHRNIIMVTELKKQLILGYQLPGQIEYFFPAAIGNTEQGIPSIQDGTIKVRLMDGNTTVWQGNILVQKNPGSQEIPLSILKIWNYDDPEPSANITVTNGGTAKIRKRSTDQLYRYKLRLKTEIPVSLAIVKNGSKSVVRENILEFADNFFTVDLPQETLHIEVTMQGYKPYVVTLQQE